MTRTRARRPPFLLALAPLALLLGACSHAPRAALGPYGPDAPPAQGPPPPAGTALRPVPPGGPLDAAPEAPGPLGAELGDASFYAPSFEGRRTANGETYSGAGFTAAHRTLPFGTRVRVTNLRNHRSVEVVINDRGPHRRGRVIDLSRRAAERLGLVREGVGRVRLEVVALAVGDAER